MKGFPSNCPRCQKANFTSYYKENEVTKEKERFFKCNNCGYEYPMK